MAGEEQLSDVLSEFARTLITDFPIQGILDRLVERIVEVLPVTACGVTLISPGRSPQYVAASNPDALRFEVLQTELGQGPCLTAYDTGDPVLVEDLALNGDYPVFGPAAIDAGMAAVFTFPLRHGEVRLGALDLYRHSVGQLSAQNVAAAQTLADVAAAYLLNAEAREQAKYISDRFRESALHDALTGLPNRLLLQERLQQAARRAQRSHTTAAVLFADIDHFKWVNDTHGHPVGDLLLIEVARRLSAVLRPGDTLARVSGDEFVILCEDMGHPKDVEHLAGRIQAAFGYPFVLGGIELEVTASVGIAYSGPGEQVSLQLVADADQAMYEAKRRGGGGHQMFNLRQANEVAERQRLEDDLRKAVRRDQLALAYQPIVRTADGLVIGVEALLRWTHPEQGPVAALTAVSIAEQSGLIVDIGAWVLQQACRDRTQWKSEHPDQPLDLWVNMSVRQLLSPGLSSSVAAVLDSTGMDASALTLEVTEGIFIEDDERAMSVLAELKTLGLALALDDFGTGYCSLAYLQRFPVDKIKIDGSFVSDIEHNRARAAIVASVTDLSHVLGLGVTAEGVETERQREELLALGCDLAQGYFYARPMSAADISVRLGAHEHDGIRLPEPPRVTLPAGG